MSNSFVGTLAGPPRAAPFWRVLLVLLLCAITYLAFAPAPPPQATFGWDKLNHVAAFVALSVAAYMSVVRSGAVIAAVVLSYGALIEVVQSFIPGRSAEWGDLLADGLGIGVGWVVAKALVWLVARK